MPGRTSQIKPDGKTSFKNLPNPFEATRYHSLIVKRETLPSCLEISAETAEGEIMGLRHRTLAVERSEEHTSELQSRSDLVCRLLLEKKKKKTLSCRTSISPSCLKTHPPQELQ